MERSPAESLPWARRYDDGVPLELDYPEMPIYELFRQTVKLHPGRTALIFFGKTLTYGRLGRYVEQVAAALQDLGVGPGYRVALLLPNCPQYVISYYAVLLAGGTVVPVNPLSTATELLHIFRDGQVGAAIGLDLLAGRLEEVRDKLLEATENHLLEHRFYTSLGEFMPFPLNLLYPLKRKMAAEAKRRLTGCERFSSLLSSRPGRSGSAALDLKRDPAALIYTGGTTGRPKGVMLSHYALVVNASQCAAWVRMSASDRQLVVLPMFHGFGMSVGMNASLIAGSSCILLPRFGAAEILEAVDRFRPTLFAGVPTMYIGLINHPRLARYDISSLRGCFVGAAPLAPEVKRRFEELTGSKLMEGYGLTEAVTAICANPYQGVNKTGSVGIPFPDTVISIRDLETGQTQMPPGEIGELALKCPEVMLGYYNRPEETAAALKQGWLFTGDLGYMDEEGYFYIVDRKKDMIISGGFNIYPREVEDVLYRHPAVAEASVIGIPDSYRGELVKAFISLKEGCSASEAEVVSFCRQHLLPYKVPSVVEICQELPKTAIGKILKRELRNAENNQPSRTAVGGNE